MTFFQRFPPTMFATLAFVVFTTGANAACSNLRLNGQDNVNMSKAVRATAPNGFSRNLMTPDGCWRYVMWGGNNAGDAYHSLQSEGAAYFLGVYRSFAEAQKDVGKNIRALIKVDITKHSRSQMGLAKVLKHSLKQDILFQQGQRVLRPDFAPEIETTSFTVKIAGWGQVTMYTGGFVVPRNAVTVIGPCPYRSNKSPNMYVSRTMFYATLKKPTQKYGRAWVGYGQFHFTAGVKSLSEAGASVAQATGFLKSWRHIK